MKKTILTFLVAILIGVTLWNLHKSRKYQLFGELVHRVETTDSVIALTFDDGPHPGSIILLHPFYQNQDQTFRALPEIINQLHAKGYRFVTVSELMKH